jgi:hypothetical protein
LIVAIFLVVDEIVLLVLWLFQHQFFFKGARFDVFILFLYDCELLHDAGEVVRVAFWFKI